MSWANIVKTKPEVEVKEVKKVDKVGKKPNHPRVLHNWVQNTRRWKSVSRKDLGLPVGGLYPSGTNKLRSSAYHRYRPFDPVYRETFYDMIDRNRGLDEYLKIYPNDLEARKDAGRTTKMISDYIWLN